MRCKSIIDRAIEFLPTRQLIPLAQELQKDFGDCYSHNRTKSHIPKVHPLSATQPSAKIQPRQGFTHRRVRSASGSAPSYLTAPPRGVFRVRISDFSTWRKFVISLFCYCCRNQDSPERGSWILFALAHHQHSDLGSSNHTHKAVEENRAVQGVEPSFPMMMCEEVSKAKVVLAGPTNSSSLNVQPNHMRYHNY